jgi:2,3-dihydroxybiphenyl 1,2-dioxygenase
VSRAAGDPQLAYLGFEVRDPAAWERFAVEVLGLGVSERRAGGGFSLRLDSRAQRFLVEPGPADDVFVMGWEWPDEASLQGTIERLRSAGVAIEEGSRELAAARKVAVLYRATDPGGMPIELVRGSERADAPFHSALVPGGFIAEELGLGHAVVSAASQSESLAFYTRMLGLRLSDKIVCDIGGYHVDIAFLHANRRHHSLALGERQKRRIHHFMIEARVLDDVGLCLDRCLAGGVRIMQTLGRHPNDRMLSFYARTPSGFQFEYGWGGRLVDDESWQPTTYDHISEWGHHPPERFARSPEPRGTTIK